jgi:hypothetical protein
MEHKSEDTDIYPTPLGSPTYPHLTIHPFPLEQYPYLPEMSIYRPYDHWGTGTTKTSTSQPSPNSRQRPPHLVHLDRPTEQRNESETPKMRVLRVFPFTAQPRQVHPRAMVPTSPYHPSAAPRTLSLPRNEEKQRNESETPEMRVLRVFPFTATTHRVYPGTMGTKPAQHPSPAPCIAGTPEDNKKREQAEFCKKVQDLLERMTEDVKGLRMDMAARSVTISSTPQLPISPMVHTPPQVRSLPSLAWVPSPPSITPILLVTHPVPASPMFPPGLQKPRQSLPHTTETILSSPPQPKPDLGPVVHTIVLVTPEEAHPPHPILPSTTGVVLFSLLLLHHRGSHHGPVVLQLVISKPSGNRPDPEPPPVVHHSTVLRLELDISLVVCFHSFLYIFLYFIFF